MSVDTASARAELQVPTELTHGLPLTVERTDHAVPADERADILANPAFGSRFTDHMLTVRWTDGLGWHDALISAYGPLSLDPSAAVLHYAQEIFEGLKAYRQEDGAIVTFRPEANAARFARSAHRLAMPEFPADAFVTACDALVAVDSEWVPTEYEKSLYLRPFMIATEPFLGVRPAKAYTFAVIASPAAGYFSGGATGVSVYATEDYVRAAPGGTGEAKCGGNYAASLLAQAQAAAEGCDQVVWLDGIERKYVEEMGGMNLFFVYGSGSDAHLVTPELTGTLLPGITRKSLVEAAGDFGLDVDERKITLAEWRDDVAAGAITETFACGTAAVITPVYSVKARTGDFTIGSEPGPVSAKLREHLLGVQHGVQPDTHGWTHRVG